MNPGIVTAKGTEIGIEAETGIEIAEMIEIEIQATAHMIEAARVMTVALVMIGETEIVTVEETMVEIQIINPIPTHLTVMIMTHQSQTANVEENPSGTRLMRKVRPPPLLLQHLPSLSLLLPPSPSPLS